MKHLLSSSGFLIVNKRLAKIIGLKTSALLADLISKEEYFKEKGTLDNGWFFNCASNIEKDTTLTPYQQKKSIDKLKELGIVETKLKGLPATLHFKLYENKLLSLFDTSIQVSQKVDTKELKSNNNNLTIITKNNIINRELEFKEIVFQVSDISKDVLNEFCDYWTEPNKSGTKMRFELQKTFDINRRLSRWSKNTWNKPQQTKVQKNIQTWKTLKERS